MPRQNRVNPYGKIIATHEKGLFMGNRGIIHNDDGAIIMPYQAKAWIICQLSFKGQRLPLMEPGANTQLFFLDEATALAAGHRPCNYCRRDRAQAFRQAWLVAHGAPAGNQRLGLPDIDKVLHQQRLTGDHFKKDKRKRTYEAALGSLPAGTFVVWTDAPHLWWEGRLWGWTPAGYQAPIMVPAAGPVTVLTPPATVGVLRQGYVPIVHESVKTAG